LFFQSGTERVARKFAREYFTRASTLPKAVFDPQPFKNPLRRVPLLRRCRLVELQDRVADRNERSQRWAEFLP